MEDGELGGRISGLVFLETEIFLSKILDNRLWFFVRKEYIFLFQNLTLVVR